MILPDKIIGRNKIRDAAICIEFERLNDDESFPTLKAILLAITAKFGLKERRLLQIVMDNHAYIPIDKEREKRKRIWALKRAIKNSPESKKDKADLMEQLRIEIEGVKFSGTIEHKVDINIEGKSDEEIIEAFRRYAVPHAN